MVQRSSCWVRARASTYMIGRPYRSTGACGAQGISARAIMHEFASAPLRRECAVMPLTTRSEVTCGQHLASSQATRKLQEIPRQLAGRDPARLAKSLADFVGHPRL